MLGIGSATLVAVASRWLPYSTTRDWITDAFALPGGWIAALVYPDGVHGGNATAWATVAVVANLLVYTVFWYVVVTIITRDGKPSRAKMPCPFTPGHQVTFVDGKRQEEQQ